MGGDVRKILRINLTSKQVRKEHLDAEFAGRYLSGRGLAGKILTDEVPAHVDAFSPENKLLLATGLLTGTTIPTSGRFMAVTKSPVNGGLVFSNFGGTWGSQLKFAGYDLVILEGKAEYPVYIVIRNDSVEIKNAAHVWGKDVFAATEALKQEIRDPMVKTLTIGPAGENLSLMAVITNDLNHVAGRSGVGAVMGSKNLKAIMVRGTGKVETADPVALKRILTDALQKFKGIKWSKDDACFQCPFPCGHRSKGKRGEALDSEQSLAPELGSNLGIYDGQALQDVSALCNRLGLDQAAVSSVIATGIELVRRGYIKPEELDGIPLEFGNSQGILEWIEKIAYSEGLGVKMGLGSKHLAASYDALDISETPKKRKRAKTPVSEDLRDLTVVIDSVGLCLFTSGTFSLSDYTELVNAVIGSKYANEELLACGAQIRNNERLYNLSVGQN
ncbi:aldehyde ferredoxin oxidoreductase N-terminal domain-containing protein [Desulfosporosinus sp. PR]|uniref:aldehyde ferredoxin oxidoreductase N-terminal domain-containing protein n=1 Tax=Candidatus Desulfosporosinus nitrosoreducens TaxID=3401928 RepID=UPI0027F6B0A0|nr:aldehyde ferredoxin oxidoreductase N-terminal domain-containing protein [Desulfosporosinus sp. PR]MDQ7092881.1 aldehyde ferredoxin oxidoreductase N-terminal domain-containing protein [Desulfosporosinus sp. PR]